MERYEYPDVIDAFDAERLELEFEALRREHESCCAGALLTRFDEGGYVWVNLIVPSKGMSLRPFA